MGSQEKSAAVIRPVLSWNDVARTTDGGGPAIPERTIILRTADEFAARWKALNLLGRPPQVNFNDYTVVSFFRQGGVSFVHGAGLVVDSAGDARLSGVLPTQYVQTNAGQYGETMAVFPIYGIKSIHGVKLIVERSR